MEKKCILSTNPLKYRLYIDSIDSVNSCDNKFYLIIKDFDVVEINNLQNSFI